MIKCCSDFVEVTLKLKLRYIRILAFGMSLECTCSCHNILLPRSSPTVAD